MCFQFSNMGFKMYYSCLLLFNERDNCIRIGLTQDPNFFTLQSHFD